MSMLLLKRTPQLSLTQVTQIGSVGFFSRDPTLSVLLMFSSADQTSSPTSLLSGTPNLPSVNWTAEMIWMIFFPNFEKHSLISIWGFHSHFRCVSMAWRTQLGADWRDRNWSGTFRHISVKHSQTTHKKQFDVFVVILHFYLWLNDILIPFQRCRIMHCIAPASRIWF